MENWKDVIDYEGFYEISDHGRVRTVERTQYSYGGRSWVKPSKINKTTFDGRYMVITLAKLGQRKRFYVHDLVLTAFVGKRPEGMHGCHGDGNGQNNLLTNLRWDTPSANNEDKRDHKTLAMGESHGMNKYTEAQIQNVKMLLCLGLNATQIESETGVHRITVAAVRSGRQWKHLNTKMGEKA